MSQERKRFVLLRHVLPDAEHWDLMLDIGSVLATWQVTGELLHIGPSGWQVGPVDRLPSQRIADHRKLYLEYEGPISGGRGTVIRHDQGYFTIITQNDNEWIVQLDGTILHGIYCLPERSKKGSGFFGLVGFCLL